MGVGGRCKDRGHGRGCAEKGRESAPPSERSGPLSKPHGPGRGLPWKTATSIDPRACSTAFDPPSVFAT